MGKSKIRIRRQVLNPLDIDRHKDYSSLLRRHERERRRKRFVRFVTFSILITLIVLLFLTIISYLWFDVAKRSEANGTRKTATAIARPTAPADPHVVD